MMRANLWLRTASRVLVRVASFKAKEFYELEQRAKKIPWAEFIAAGDSAEFRVTARKSKLYHSDAIAERLVKSLPTPPKPKTAAGRKPATVTGANPPLLFVVRVVHDEFTVSADTSGDLLHMRGYRQAAGKAPLRETLAAALLLAADWTGDAPLLDPFCGSGTIPIEAALIARRLPPGGHRDFAFEHWPRFDADAWRTLRQEAFSGALASSPVAIRGCDRDAGAIEASRANAARAGVPEIEFTAMPVSAIRPFGTHGQIATNPPYGKRVSAGKDTRNLYAQLGNVARKYFGGWRLGMFAAEPRLSGQVGLPLREILRSLNGGIRVSALLGAIPGATPE